MEGAARNVIIPPFDHQDVLSLVFELVADIIQAVAQMFYQDLLTGDFRAIHPNQQHVPTYGYRGTLITMRVLAR